MEVGAVWSGSTLFASILDFVSNVRQLFAADDFSRWHFQMHFFLGALRVNMEVGAVWSGSTLFASILDFVSNVRQLFAADDFCRWHFQMHFFLGALRVNMEVAEHSIWETRYLIPLDNCTE